MVAGLGQSVLAEAVMPVERCWSVAPNGAGTTRVGRWMSEAELDEMAASGRVVEGGGGKTYVVEPPSTMGSADDR